MKVSLVIPQYNRYDLTHQRFLELYQHIPASLDVEIILVDDCSPNLKPGDVNGINWWKKQVSHHRIRNYRNQENLGFGGTCNRGAELAEGDVLVILSNDVVVRGDFITPILNILKDRPRVLIGGDVVDWNGGWNQIPVNGSSVIVPYASGWLLACTKEVWSEIGGFDPRYGRFDYEDVDLSTTAYFKGIELVALRSSLLHHISGATISTLNVDRLAQTNKNREVYIEKWRDAFEKSFVERSIENG